MVLKTQYIEQAKSNSRFHVSDQKFWQFSTTNFNLKKKLLGSDVGYRIWTSRKSKLACIQRWFTWVFFFFKRKQVWAHSIDLLIVLIDSEQILAIHVYQHHLLISARDCDSVIEYHVVTSTYVNPDTSKLTQISIQY
jgi:hypothetical protein